MASKNQGRIITFICVLVAFFGGIYLSKMIRDTNKGTEHRPAEVVDHSDIKKSGAYATSQNSPVVDKTAAQDHVTKTLYKDEPKKFRINKAVEPIFGNMKLLKEQPLSDFKGKLIVANLWTVHCKYCSKEIPTFVKMSKSFAGQPVVFMSVSMDTNEAFARKFLKDNNIKLSTLYMDTRRTLRRRYDTRQLPMTLIIGPEGQTFAQIKVPVNWESKKSKATIQKYLDKAFPKKKTGETN